MRALQVTSNGSPGEVLPVVDIPEPGPSDVRINVSAAALNFNDIDRCRGTLVSVPAQPPYTLDMDARGVVGPACIGSIGSIGYIDIFGVILAWDTAVDRGMRSFGLSPFGRDVTDAIQAGLLRLAADGKIRPVIGRRAPMQAAGKALDEHEARHTVGRTVVMVTQ